MTVAELIKTLEGMPQNAVVCLSVYRHSYDSVNHEGSHGKMVVAPWYDCYDHEQMNRVIIASSADDLGK